jgi:hypothetical protein
MSYDVCKKEWLAMGKDHRCILPEGHGLTCECDCGERKWMGKKLIFGKAAGRPA